MNIEEIISLHKECTYNKDELMRIESLGMDCSCFYCGKRFNPKEIKEWTDKGQTAICPHCGIDAVGYGLAQWTYWTRKQNLLNFARQNNKSIGARKNNKERRKIGEKLNECKRNFN